MPVKQFSHSPEWSIVSSIFSNDIISSAVLIFLLIASIISWTIIVKKLHQYKIFSLQLKQILSHMNKTISFSNFTEKIDIKPYNLKQSISLIQKEYNSICKMEEIGSITKKEKLQEILYQERIEIIEYLEEKLNLLATISSVSPFIGLLGTVWGIMHSFQSIAFNKNINLAVVAPGIAEALFATAVGLLTAIPAIIFYNHFSNKIEKIINILDRLFAKIHSSIN